MMKIKTGIALVSVASLLSSGAAYGSAETEDPTVDICLCSASTAFSAPAALEGVGEITIKETMQIGVNNYSLYPTFDNPDSALNTVKEDASEVICLLQEAYGLDDFSDTTWKKYQSKSLEMLDASACPDWYNEQNEAFCTLRAFFDIYENDEENEKILKEAGFVSEDETSIAVSSQDIDLGSDLMIMLPDQSVLVEQTDEEVVETATVSTTAVNGFTVKKGKKYAKSHATSPNTSTYGYFPNADCTNFASQILENGDVDQVVYDSNLKGWWHKKTTGLFGIVSHSYSNSWTVADTFAKYMGVGYKSKSNAKFSNNIKAGDFVAADYTRDGNWDHVGFVMATKDTKSNGYYDYKIAQHTTNYLAWASSDTNNWEKIGNNGGTYARVRR